MVLSKKDKEFALQSFQSYKKTMSKTAKKKLAFKMIEYIQDNNKAQRSITNKISLLKKYFREKTNDPDVFNYIHPDKYITISVKEKDTSVLNKTVMTTIKKSDIKDSIAKWSKSDKLSEQIAFVLLSTGRRTGEILKGMFKSTRKKNKILIKGILKKRHNETDDYIEIETIADSNITYKQIISLQQKMVKYKEPQTKLQKELKTVKLGDKTYNSHMYRVIYANYLFNERNKNKYIYNVFIGNILNHSSLTSSINYSSVQIV